jgi:hypothetical protein
VLDGVKLVFLVMTDLKTFELLIDQRRRAEEERGCISEKKIYEINWSRSGSHKEMFAFLNRKKINQDMTKL